MPKAFWQSTISRPPRNNRGIQRNTGKDPLHAFDSRWKSAGTFLWKLIVTYLIHTELNADIGYWAWTSHHSFFDASNFRHLQSACQLRPWKRSVTTRTNITFVLMDLIVKSRSSTLQGSVDCERKAIQSDRLSLSHHLLNSVLRRIAKHALLQWTLRGGSLLVRQVGLEGRRRGDCTGDRAESKFVGGPRSACIRSHS